MMTMINNNNRNLNKSKSQNLSILKMMMMMKTVITKVIINSRQELEGKMKTLIGNNDIN